MSGFQFAQTLGGPAVPRTIEKQLATATLTKGAALFVNADGKYEECGADPAVIAAIGATPAGTSSDYSYLRKDEFPAGYMQGITTQGTVFSCEYVGTLPAADGGEYGIIKDSDNDWKIDFSDVANPRVKLVGRMTATPESQNRVLVSFLPGVTTSI